MKKQFLFVIIIALSASYVTGAQILNGSFEVEQNDPNFSWQSSGCTPVILRTFSTLEHGSNVNVTIGPNDGQYFVLLHSGGGTRETSYGQLTQRITVNTGESITGAYFFSTSDWVPPWNDTATIKLVPDPCSGLTEILLAKKSVSDVNSYGSMLSWATFSCTFTDANAGSYTLTLRVEDVQDNAYASYLAVDALKIVPKPGCPYALMGDINRDCVVNFYDFALLANQWLNICDSSTWCNNCDINQSYMVDFADLATIAENWLIDCYAEPGNPACVPK
ncbi:MAG: hypothetical protein NTW55_05300 [Planctomycetota bacterium]|nr:hypothetical protein [Planctomycetota bacterium]